MDEILLSLQEASMAVITNKLVASAFFWFKSIMVVLSITLFLALVYVIVRLNRFAAKTMKDLGASITIEPDEASAPKGLFQKKWDEFFERLSENRPSEWKIVVVEADNMLEDALKKAGFVGDGIGDILRRLDKSKLVALDHAWEGHRLRNAIVHEPSRQISAYEARTALENFGMAMRELGVID